MQKIAIFEQFFGHNKMNVYIFDFFLLLRNFRVGNTEIAFGESEFGPTAVCLYIVCAL